MQTSKRNGAILDDGRLNVSLLQSEIIQELGSDVRYEAEDTMKKKAILISKDYDEFRSFVACSQLKPVHRTEIGELFNPYSTASIHRNKKMNKSYSYSDRSSKKNLSNISSNALSSSQNYSQFLKSNPSKHVAKEVNKKQNRLNSISKKQNKHSSKKKKELDFKKHWKEDFQSPQQSLAKLLSIATITHETSTFESTKDQNELKTNNAQRKKHINIDFFSRIQFCWELDTTTLGNILQTLQLCLEIAETDDDDNNKDMKTLLNDSLPIHSTKNEHLMFYMIFSYHWLVKLSESDRFSINILFLNTEQKSSVESIFSFFSSHLADFSGNETNEFKSLNQDISGVNNKAIQDFSIESVSRLRSIYLL